MTVTATKIIIDCDPGIDDAVALLLAFGAPALDILGITTVAGNVSADLTVANALRIREIGQRPDIRVFAGCARPLLYAHRHGAPIHGGDGLGDIGLEQAKKSAEPQHAVNFIIDQIRAAPGEITLVVLGPMTNIATALAMAPDIADKVKQLLFMGGAAFQPGNVTAAAEFNFWFDPHAAQAVMISGMKMVMFGLDVTHQTKITQARIGQLQQQGKLGKITAKMLASYAKAGDFLHDPCVIAYLLAPQIFLTIEALCEVEYVSQACLGQSIIHVSESHLAGRKPNCLLATKVEAEKFFELLARHLQRLDR